MYNYIESNPYSFNKMMNSNEAPVSCLALSRVRCSGSGGRMHRIWLGAGAVAAFLIWLFFFQAALVLVLFAVIVAGIWIWWEIHALKKAMRTPPER